METWSIIMPVKAVGKGRPRMSPNGNVFTPKITSETEKQIQFWLLSRRPPPNFIGALEVEINIFLKQPKSNKKIFPTTYPDIDNAAKLILDACNKIVWRDDRQIVRLYVTKNYADKNEIEIKVTEI